MALIEVEPQPRIDTLVRLPSGNDARRTEYAGAAWFDGKPYVSGLTLRRSVAAPRGVRSPNMDEFFFVPDSLPYRRAALGDAVLSVSVALCGSGETSAIVGAEASFTDDPSGAPTWIQLRVHGSLSWPAGITYRIVALTSPTAAP